MLLTGQVWSGAEFRLKMPLPTVGEAVFRYLWVKFGHGERHFDESWEFYVAAACGLAVQILLFAAAVFAVMRIWRVVRPARVAGHRSEQA